MAELGFAKETLQNLVDINIASSKCQIHECDNEIEYFLGGTHPEHGKTVGFYLCDKCHIKVKGGLVITESD